MRNRRVWLASLALATASTIGVVGAPPTAAQESGAAAPATYIVRLADGIDARSAADDTAIELGQVSEVLTNVFPGVITELTPAEAADLARRPGVVAVERDQRQTGDAVQSGATWGLDRVDQRALPLDGRFSYPDSAGNGVVVYVVDSGVRRDHAELSGRVQTGYTAVSDGRGTGDCDGHGTHVAATAAGRTYGVAKRATVVPVRVLDCEGSGWQSDTIAAIDWMIGHHPAGQRAVANFSLGGNANSTYDAAIQRLIDDGVAVAVAAGNNNGDACLKSPARAAGAITVANSNVNDARSASSNFGTCVDLFAPGSGIVSAGISSSTATATMSGTSMASPHVAGVMATIWGATPSLTATAVHGRIVSDATTSRITGAGTGTPNRLLYSPAAPVARPANDDLAAAAALNVSSGGALTATNVGATAQGGEPAHDGSSASRSVWWSFTASDSRSITLTTSGSSFDTVLAVYTGSSVAGLSPTARNDDVGDGDLTSAVTFTATAGTTYRVVVDGYAGATGSVRLTWTGLGPAPWLPFASASAFIDRQFRDFVGRAATSTEITTWTNRLASGSSTAAAMIESLRQSIDNTTVVDPTIRLYRAVLRRTPDADGLQYWLGQRRSGSWSLTRTADFFVRSNEFSQRYGSLDNRAFVEMIYRDILERAGDQEGIAFWTAQLDQRRRSRGQVLIGFTESGEYIARYSAHVDASMAYYAMLRRPPSATELASWVSRRQAGTTHQGLLRELLTSSSYVV